MMNLRKNWQDGSSREEERKLLLLCFLAVLCWGLAAHAYGFLRPGFSHDMLNALVVTSGETYWKMQLGRPGIVLYRRVIRGLIAAPWFLGMLSLVWLSLGCFLTAKLFGIREKIFPILLAGILTVNISSIAMTAGYLYEMDANFFAVLVGICAVFLWDRSGWAGALLGVPLIAFCMGTYQSLVSVPVTLIMLLSITALLRGAPFSEVLRKGLRAIVMLLLGALCYWLSIRLMCAWKGINLSMNSYNRPDQSEISLSVTERLLSVYRSWVSAFWRPSLSHIELPVLCLNIIFPVLALIRLLIWLFQKETGFREKLLLILLILLLPAGMNTAQFLFAVPVHDLMKYAFWLFWLFCLLPFFLLPSGTQQTVQKGIASLLVLLILFSHIQTANVVYTRKALEQDACLSLMSRVVSRLEERDDYIPGETPLVFVGVSTQLQERLPGFEHTYDITGCESSSPITKSVVSYNYHAYAAYFRYVLNNPALMADDGTWMSLQRDPRIQEMPSFPDAGCMQMFDGVLVVKMSSHFAGAVL